MFDFCIVFLLAQVALGLVIVSRCGQIGMGNILANIVNSYHLSLIGFI